MDSREKIADIIYCEHGTKCKWKCFALDYEGYGHGRIENYLPAWKEWHEKECGGKLIQAVIVKEDFLSTILAKVDSAGLTDETLHKLHDKVIRGYRKSLKIEKTAIATEISNDTNKGEDEK